MPKQTNVGIDFIFFDAEDWGTPKGYTGKDETSLWWLLFGFGILVEEFAQTELFGIFWYFTGYGRSKGSDFFVRKVTQCKPLRV